MDLLYTIFSGCASPDYKDAAKKMAQGAEPHIAEILASVPSVNSLLL